MRCRISGTAAAASGMFTVIAHHLGAGLGERDALRAPCAAASAVSVLVIDCTTTGAPPPTCTAPGPVPTRTPTVRWTRISDTEAVRRGADVPRHRPQRPSANTSSPMKCSMLRQRLGRRIDEGQARDVGDVVAVDDGAAVHDASPDRDDLVVEREPQVVDVRGGERARPRPW